MQSNSSSDIVVIVFLLLLIGPPIFTMIRKMLIRVKAKRLANSLGEAYLSSLNPELLYIPSALDDCVEEIFEEDNEISTRKRALFLIGGYPITIMSNGQKKQAFGKFAPGFPFRFTVIEVQCGTFGDGVKGLKRLIKDRDKVIKKVGNYFLSKRAKQALNDTRPGYYRFGFGFGRKEGLHLIPWDRMSFSEWDEYQAEKLARNNSYNNRS